MIKKTAMPISESDNKTIYLDIEFIKVERVFGVMANIRLIIFSKQNWLTKVKKLSLAKNKQQKINTFCSY